MVSKAEESAAASLRAMLTRRSIGDDVGDSPAWRELDSALCWFVPEVLSQLYDHWAGEDLDGINATVVRKIADRAVEIVGMCVFLDDWTEAPIHIRMSHASGADTIEWMECRVGTPGPGRGGLLRIADSADKSSKVAAEVAEDPDAVDWVFAATYGNNPVD